MKTMVWKSVLGGAMTGWICAGFGIGFAILGGVLFDWSRGGRTGWVSVFGILGCVLGGFRAGLLERKAPLSNGAGAGALTTVPLAFIGLIQQPSVARIVSGLFAVMLGASVGTFGGMVSNGSSRKSIK